MREKILNLIALTRRPVSDLVDTLIQQCQQIRTTGTVPAEFQETSDLIIKTFRDAGQTLEDAFVTIYSKHFTEEEIDQLLAVYSMPVFKKAATVAEEITSEIGMATQDWYTRLMNGIEPELRSLLGTPGEQPAAELPPDPPTAA